MGRSIWVHYRACWLNNLTPRSWVLEYVPSLKGQSSEPHIARRCRDAVGVGVAAICGTRSERNDSPAVCGGDDSLRAARIGRRGTLRLLSRSDFPVREQHAPGRMTLGVPGIRHAYICPAHAVAARNQPAERLTVTTLTPHRDAANAGLGGGRLDGRDGGIECGIRARRELEHAHFVARARIGERRRMPHGQRVEAAAGLDE